MSESNLSQSNMNESNMNESNTTIVPQPVAPPRTFGDYVLWGVRYGLGIVMVLAGVVVLLVSPSSNGVDGFALAVGGGLSVLLLNFLYRLGVSGDEERERHEEAWRYFEEHGNWPDEEPQKRQWTLPAGSVAYKDGSSSSAPLGTSK
jgi:hypothetical protein